MATDVAPYMVRILHNAGTWVRVWVNDLPMYDRAVMNFMTSQFHGTPWFIPGENSLVLEVFDAPRNPETPTVTPYFDLTLYLDAVDPADEQVLVQLKYPELLADLAPEDRKFPIVVRTTFTPEGNIPEPIWKNAPPSEIPEDGTPELWKAVYAVHDAFARRDVDAFVDSAALKLEDQVRYLGPDVRLSREGVRKEHAAMMEQPWELMPFEPTELHFRSCQDGRVAYVTRKGGGPAIYAQHRTAPQSFKVKPLLVRQGADWRVYR